MDSFSLAKTQIHKCLPRQQQNFSSVPPFIISSQLIPLTVHPFSVLPWRIHLIFILFSFNILWQRSRLIAPQGFHMIQRIFTYDTYFNCLVLFFFFKKNYSCFTMFCQVLLYSKVSQLYIFIHSFLHINLLSPREFPLWLSRNESD